MTAHIFERSGVSWIVFEELLHLLSQIRNVFVLCHWCSLFTCGWWWMHHGELVCWQGHISAKPMDASTLVMRCNAKWFQCTYTKKYVYINIYCNWSHPIATNQDCGVSVLIIPSVGSTKISRFESTCGVYCPGGSLFGPCPKQSQHMPGCVMAWRWSWQSDISRQFIATSAEVALRESYPK